MCVLERVYVIVVSLEVGGNFSTQMWLILEEELAHRTVTCTKKIRNILYMYGNKGIT